MNVQEFEQLYKSETPIYSAWGNYVNSQILEELEKELIDRKSFDTFLKVPSTPRVKELNSILSKAFARNKSYTDPYNEITDKVGVRYVVLLRKDIEFVSKIIEQNQNWSYTKSRDYEDEKEKYPLLFDYQSVHYVVRNNNKIVNKRTSIPSNTPCEIQVRTLLQHAYAELTHDTIYKPKVFAANNVRRSIAKSMALIEATDDIFSEVEMILSNENHRQNSLLQSLLNLYNTFAVSDYAEGANLFVLDAYREISDTVSIQDLRTFIEENAGIKDTVLNKAQAYFLYRQPVILFVLYLIATQRNTCKQYWPLPESDLRPMFADMGIAFDM